MRVTQSFRALGIGLWPRYASHAKQIGYLRGIGNRESGIGNREREGSVGGVGGVGGVGSDKSQIS
ncbi:MAG: hypothetical protein F6K50_26665 [Moorea sp. SIO3I7]|uniref:Uncharacterized protein n=1 Tax=Moorena bouillonii PNG TaxID=568701 RepID=A0A1U7N4I4_9CYAN|nr:hypothetical protein [Moorena sp. SIO3I7]NEO59106.1 hypothetical protein [Moorena sp. SIO4G2]OLT60857.1 hypothetical protein BJP37_19400 [Moorena bouillonii PNG]